MINAEQKIAPGMLVRVNSYVANCHRVDGTGTGWDVVRGTVWYVVEAHEAISEGYWKLDDRNRPELEGKPAFDTIVHECELEPADD